MHPITKKLEIELKKLANMLPIQLSNTPISRALKGSHLAEMGITKTKNGSDINAHKAYIAPTEHKQPINHLRRLRTAYQNNGEAGVNTYVANIKAAMQLSNV